MTWPYAQQYWHYGETDWIDNEKLEPLPGVHHARGYLQSDVWMQLCQEIYDRFEFLLPGSATHHEFSYVGARPELNALDSITEPFSRNVLKTLMEEIGAECERLTQKTPDNFRAMWGQGRDPILGTYANPGVNGYSQSSDLSIDVSGSADPRKFYAFVNAVRGRMTQMRTRRHYYQPYLPDTNLKIYPAQTKFRPSGSGFPGLNFPGWTATGGTTSQDAFARLICYQGNDPWEGVYGNYLIYPSGGGTVLADPAVRDLSLQLTVTPADGVDPWAAFRPWNNRLNFFPGRLTARVHFVTDALSEAYAAHPTPDFFQANACPVIMEGTAEGLETITLDSGQIDLTEYAPVGTLKWGLGIEATLELDDTTRATWGLPLDFTDDYISKGFHFGAELVMTAGSGRDFDISGPLPPTVYKAQLGTTPEFSAP